MEQLRGELDEMKEQMGFLMLDMQDLKEENRQLKTQLGLVMEILGTVLRKGDDPRFSTATGVTIPPYTLGNSLSPKVGHASAPPPCVPRSPRLHPIPVVQKGLDKALQLGPSHSEKQFDPIPMPYAQLLPQLLKFRLVELQTLVMPEGFLFEYDVTARCDLHSGAP